MKSKSKKKPFIHPLELDLEAFKDLQPAQLDTDELKKLQALCVEFGVKFIVER